MKTGKREKLSLHPMKLSEAVSDLLKVKRSPKAEKPKAKKSSGRKK
jgi:hypothetical protein